MTTYTDAQIAELILELAVADLPRAYGVDLVPDLLTDARLREMTLADAERLTGLTLAEATRIIETEGTIIS